MKKDSIHIVHMQNIEMIPTQRCNFSCAHCMRGKFNNHDMSDQVIEKTLEETVSIGNLAIGGGEPFLALDRIEKIFSYIVDNNIIIDMFGLVTNGTLYNKEVERLFDYLESYISSWDKRYSNIRGYIALSNDEYHKAELEATSKDLKEDYIEKINALRKSKYFLKEKLINNKLFREGNANNLDKSLTVPLRPMRSIITYVGNDGGLISCLKRGPKICNIGPIICVNTNGTITECDASYEDQENKYNYGNVLTDSIEETCRTKRKSLVVPPRLWNAATIYETNKYHDYNH